MHHTDPLTHLLHNITAHCWHEGPPDTDGMPRTCMLPVGHGGNHDHIRDDQNRFGTVR